MRYYDFCVALEALEHFSELKKSDEYKK